jgi:3-phosphoshikimate 1-carboxyvinyltransferase
MDILIDPGRPLRGEIMIPGDKSLSHRAALFAALASGESRVENFLSAGVTHSLIGALVNLGIPCELEVDPGGDKGSATKEGRENQHSTLIVRGAGFDGIRPPAGPLGCGNSGTTMRFLAGALAAAGIAAILDGSDGLRRRPMDRVVDPLREMGAPIQASSDGRAPLILSGRPAGSKLQAINYRLPMASAQVKTALILAALRADGPSCFIEPHRSRDHTERMLRSLGAGISAPEEEGGEARVRVSPLTSDLTPLIGRLAGDLSSAAFLIVAALIVPGSEIVIRGVGLNPTRTGLLDALIAMGASIQIFNRGSQLDEPYGDLRVRYGELQAQSIAGPQVVRMIDEIPIFAVAAARAEGRSDVRQAQELRLKESDRISALCQELKSMDVRVSEKPDGFAITGPQPICGGEVQAHADHRLAMALTVAGLAARSPTRIQGAGITSESYPGFFNALQRLGANIRSV